MSIRRTRARNRSGISIFDRWKNHNPIGRHWLYRVWDDRARKYVGKSFDDGPEDVGRTIPGCMVGDVWAKDQAAKLHLGIESSIRPTLAGVRPRYITRLHDRGRAERSIAGAEFIIDRALEAGINDLLDPNLPDLVQGWLARMTSGRGKQHSTRLISARTRNSYLNCLRAVANFAVRRRMLAYNPFLAVDLFDEPKRFRKVYSIDELRRIVSDKYRVHLWWIFAVLAAYTGLRSSTLRLLTWAMVDWSVGRIRVPAEITKTYSDIRVPIQPELAAILKEQPAIGSRTILPKEIATLSSDECNARMQRYLIHVGVQPNGRSVHCFRHSVASLLTATGMPHFLVMDGVGHSSTATSKHYSRGADEYRGQVKAEKWPEGEFFLRRAPSMVVNNLPQAETANILSKINSAG